MCRLVLMNKNGEKEIEKNYGLENYLKFLEDSLGGHGNGYALLRKGKVIDLAKGKNLSVKEIANTIRKKNYDWCIFHTRYASIGVKSDSNCHPFIRNDTEVMAMNGTESNIDFLAGPLEITDTEAILDIKVKYNFELPVLKHFSSEFIGFTKGKPYVVANNLYNLKLLSNPKRKAIAFASSFPESFKKNIYRPTETFIWNGEEINMNKFTKYTGLKQFKTLTYKPYLSKNEIEDDEFLNYLDTDEIDNFDYYTDFYEKYEKEQDMKEGEKNAA